MEKELMGKKSEDLQKKEKQNQKVKKRKNDCWGNVSVTPIIEYINTKDNTTIAWQRIKFYA